MRQYMLKYLEKHLAIIITSAVINIIYAFYESIINLFPTKLLLLGKLIMKPNQKNPNLQSPSFPGALRVEPTHRSFR